jgi:hypothetical protein
MLTFHKINRKRRRIVAIHSLVVPISFWMFVSASAIVTRLLSLGPEVSQEITRRIQKICNVQNQSISLNSPCGAFYSTHTYESEQEEKHKLLTDINL